jgi:hypothetical protein
MKTTKLNLRSYSIGVFITLLLGSCAPAYIPNVVNAPLLSNQGEVQAAVYSGVSGFDPQFAVAATDHLGFMVNGSFANRTSDTLSANYHRHEFIEFAAGYYTKMRTRGRFEVFSGMGYGKVKSEWDGSFWQSYATVKSMRVFVQPSIGTSNNVFDGSFSTRFVYLDLYQGKTRNAGIFIEPVVTAKVGFKYFKVVTQFGFSAPLGFRNQNFEYQPFIISMGLHTCIGKIFEK